MNPFLWNQQQFWMGPNMGQLNFQQPFYANNYNPRMQFQHQQRPRFQNNINNKGKSPKNKDPPRPNGKCEDYVHSELEFARKSLTRFVENGPPIYCNPLNAGGPNTWEGATGMMDHIKTLFPMPDNGEIGPQAVVCDPKSLGQNSNTLAASTSSNMTSGASPNTHSNTGIKRVIKRPHSEISAIVVSDDDDNDDNDSDDVQCVSSMMFNVSSMSSSFLDTVAKMPSSNKKKKKSKQKGGKFSKRNIS